MSATRCDISWLAYTTGAGSCAFTTDPGGAVTVTGRQQPELGGIRLFGSAIIFSAQNTPDAVTVSGAFIGPGDLRIGAGEIRGDGVAALA